MKIELHMIQNFPPACLNRDDTNSPKDCIFGGYRRARVSSQCLKRSIRTSFNKDNLLDPQHLAYRTKRIAEKVASRMAEKGRDYDTALKAATTALGGLGLGFDDDGRSQYLIFLGESGVQALQGICEGHWDELAEIVQKIQQAEEEGSAKDAKKAKKEAKAAVPKEMKQELLDVLDGSKTADLALFGRMLADLPDKNIDAACQLAHAISTNKAAMEMDFYTAVDDLKSSEEDAGAGMMGVIGFNSACFYRYAMLDWEKLVDNLGGDVELAQKTVKAFLKASALALPTGKQNTFAAHSRPDLIMVNCRENGAPLSLANAFTQPASPNGQADLTQASVDKLSEYWEAVNGVYGSEGQVATLFCATTQPSKTPDDWENTGSLDSLVDKTLACLNGKASE